ncbi:hypothetical protein MPSEU_000070100 [Mayamaea pseudoterrestris]|nr:hypothetical protein MPSEU_000070100 [Mayamaea pseudoterrestris]
MSVEVGDDHDGDDEQSANDEGAPCPLSKETDDAIKPNTTKSNHVNATDDRIDHLAEQLHATKPLSVDTDQPLAPPPVAYDDASVFDMEAAVTFARNKGNHETKNRQTLMHAASSCSETVLSQFSFGDLTLDSPRSVEEGDVIDKAIDPPNTFQKGYTWPKVVQKTKESPSRCFFLAFFIICLVVLLPAMLAGLLRDDAKNEGPAKTAPSLDSSHVSFTTPMPASEPTMSPTASHDSIQESPPTTFLPTQLPSSSPVASSAAEYIAGKLDHRENQLLLSQGLSSKIIANAGKRVKYPITGKTSTVSSHAMFDFGATFATGDGGWVYLSNSEVDDNEGGVGAFEFDAQGNVINYKMLLTNTSKNCGGGKTPWNAYVTCEEVNRGRCYQVDPTGRRASRMLTVGEETNGAKFESFAHWTRNQSAPEFFVTEDDANSTLRRFIPDDPDWSDPWSMLIGSGSTTYLLLRPSDNTFRWTFDVDAARINGGENFPGAEGIDQIGNRLYFISKTAKKMFTLDLLDGTYTEQPTKIGRFDGQPDQIVRTAQDNAGDVFFFTQDADNACGISAKDDQGTYTLVDTLQTRIDETAGLAFSPDGRHMYFAMQKAGILYDITRDDGGGFHEQPSQIVYEKRSNSD